MSDNEPLESRRRELNALNVKILPDGREVSLLAMIYNVRMCIGEPNAQGYDDAYCFADRVRAEQAFAKWDGRGEPEGWIKHINTQRYRPNGDPSAEYVQGKNNEE